jgi:hypothetical protein
MPTHEAGMKGEDGVIAEQTARDHAEVLGSRAIR